MIEKNRIGGAGVYNGVLASKALWEQSLKIAAIRELIPDYTPKFEDISKIVNEAVFERKTQMTIHLQLLQKQTNRLLFYEKGSAYLKDKNMVQITKEDGSVKAASATYILLTTGSRPRKPANIKLVEQTIVTSDGLRNFTEFPKSMVVLGAGFIGCEFVTIFSGFGTTKVSLIDKADRVLPFEDEDIADVIKHNLEASNARLHQGV